MLHVHTTVPNIKLNELLLVWRGSYCSVVSFLCNKSKNLVSIAVFSRGSKLFGIAGGGDMKLILPISIEEVCCNLYNNVLSYVINIAFSQCCRNDNQQKKNYNVIRYPLIVTDHPPQHPICTNNYKDCEEDSIWFLKF